MKRGMGIFCILLLGAFAVQADTAGISAVPQDLNTVQAVAPQHGGSAVLDELCPPDSLLSQIPTGPDGSWSFGTSDLDSGYRIAEWYSITGQVVELTWWGLALQFDGGWSGCTEDPTPFTITMYEDNGGVPGAEACSYTVNVTPVYTGVLYSGIYELVRYNAILAPCTLMEGWLVIEGGPEGDICWFLWGSSEEGPQLSLQYNAGEWGATDYSRALCIGGEYVPTFGACCDDSTGMCEDGVEIINCTGRFVADTLCADLDPPCGEIPGACCYPDGTCEILTESECIYPCGDIDLDGDVDIDDFYAFVGLFGTCDGGPADLDGDGCVTLLDYNLWIECYRTGGGMTGDWLGENTTCDMCPCVIFCPEGGVPEDEPCGEDTNGGCNMDVPTFEPIECGMTKCGTAWFDGSTRDTDWYELVLTETQLVTLTAEFEFEGIFGPIGQVVPGVPGCDNTTGSIDPYLILPECTPGTLSVEFGPGTYYIFAATTFAANVECPGDYYLTVTCEDVPVGACCLPDGTCEDGLSIGICEGLSGTFQGDGTLCQDIDCPPPIQGDFCTDPFIVDALPYYVEGSTVGFFNSYDEVCPYSGSTSPDVVYAYTATEDVTVTIDLCESFYDTKVYVYENDCVGGEAIACNDDACSNSQGEPYRSRLDEVMFTAGNTYYVVVDGYGGQSGDYILEIIPLGAGACCLPDTTCQDGLTQVGCDNLGGIFQGIGVMCADVTCPSGACCLPTGECVQVLNETVCLDLGGDYQGDGVLCEDVDCPEPQGGDACESATLIDALPYYATGSTVGFNNLYDAVCPYTGSTAPDVVFAYTPDADVPVDINLCESGYDTKVYVYENDCVNGEEIACNDDACNDSQGNPFRSLLEGVQLFAGNTYYIVVDGYGSSSGNFDLAITVPGVGACCFIDGSCADGYSESACVADGGAYQGNDVLCADITCPVCEPCDGSEMPEGEPPCGDEYEDMYNGGCNSTPFVFQDVNIGDAICGKSGTFLFGGSDYRDTDWFRVNAGSAGTLTWEIEAMFPILGFIIDAGSGDCVDYTILTNLSDDTGDPCFFVTMSAAVVADQDYWLWAGPSIFTGIPCESDYRAVSSLTAGPVGPVQQANVVGEAPSLKANYVAPQKGASIGN